MGERRSEENPLRSDWLNPVDEQDEDFKCPFHATKSCGDRKLYNNIPLRESIPYCSPQMPPNNIDMCQSPASTSTPSIRVFSPTNEELISIKSASLQKSPLQYVLNDNQEGSPISPVSPLPYRTSNKYKEFQCQSRDNGRCVSNSYIEKSDHHPRLRTQSDPKSVQFHQSHCEEINLSKHRALRKTTSNSPQRKMYSRANGKLSTSKQGSLSSPVPSRNYDGLPKYNIGLKLPDSRKGSSPYVLSPRDSVSSDVVPIYGKENSDTHSPGTVSPYYENGDDLSSTVVSPFHVNTDTQLLNKMRLPEEKKESNSTSDIDSFHEQRASVVSIGVSAVVDRTKLSRMSRSLHENGVFKRELDFNDILLNQC